MRSVLLGHKAVTIEDAQATLPAPSTAADGGDISGWRVSGGPAPRYAIVKISSDGTTTLAGAYLAVYDGSAWYNAGDLNEGSNISLTSSVGWASPLLDIGIYDRVALVGTPDAGDVTAVVIPVETTG